MRIINKNYIILYLNIFYRHRLLATERVKFCSLELGIGIVPYVAQQNMKIRKYRNMNVS